MRIRLPRIAELCWHGATLEHGAYLGMVRMIPPSQQVSARVMNHKMFVSSYTDKILSSDIVH